MSRIAIYGADIVVSMAGRPIEEGAVAVQAGVLLDVGDIDELSRRYRHAETRRWKGVMTPGLVNAHTHLQYTSFSDLGAVQHDGFEAWSIAFDAVYLDRYQTEDWYQSALAGSIEALKAGTTTVADICTDHSALTAPRDAGLRAISYVEALGDAWHTWEHIGREGFLAGLRRLQKAETPEFRVGISPHAPYSLDTPVLSDLTRFARAEGFRIHTHLAESEFEDAYYRTGTGPLADFVRGFGRGFQVLERGGARMSATEFAESTGLLGRDCHVAHGIYLNEAGRRTLRETETSVALCPRSNGTIGLGDAPVAAYLEEGSPMAIGTDSRSSSPSLDLLADAASLYSIAREQGYDREDLAQRLLAAATVGGASAMGMDHPHGGVGKLEPGRAADFAVFDVQPDLSSSVEALVTTGAGRCVATCIAGQVRFDSDSG
jgi:cytosine/adenosine deaminase-related metal-dependent hydrolase